MKNILSFDVEEYFQVENFKGEISYAEWDSFESRLNVGIDCILKILSDYNVKVTFFILGWTAERHPECVRKIAAEGHEIASHGYAHELIYKQSPEQFREDLVRSITILESVSGQKIESYRAPCFSITDRSMWALDILHECGIRNDSSIFPIHHHRYGIPDADKLPHIRNVRDGHTIKEFPISIYELCGRHIPFAGGGYFRLLPLSWIVNMSRALNASGYPLVMYLHPWEFDPEQPRVKTKNPLNAFRHYVNLHSTEEKLRRLLDHVDVGMMRGFTIQDSGISFKTYKTADVTKKEKHISVVIPLYNEEESVRDLVDTVSLETSKLTDCYELILVDDGSTDATVSEVKKLQESYRHVRLVKLRRNFGQTPAMVAGFDVAEGDIIVTLDGDLQNDPRDMLKVVDKIYEGYDVASGWRYHRKDHWLTRCLPSMIANWLISRVTGVELHDYGCSLKAYRAEVIKSVNAYGEMHRFFPAVASLAGAKTAEVIVNHFPRKYGVSKYGLERTFKVLADLVTMHLLTKFFRKPMQYFGLLAVVVSALSFSLALFFVLPYHDTIVPVGAVSLLLFLALHFLMIGLLCTLIVRNGDVKPADLSLKTAHVFK